MNVPFSVVISAGGQSSRMGTDKAFVQVGGQRILNRVIAVVASLGAPETLLITNRPADYAGFGLPMFGDVVAGKGALGGVHAALTHATYEYVLLVACDMPFLQPPLLRYMVAQLDATPPPDVVVPRVDRYPQGLHAVYSKACLPPIEARLAADRLKVIGFYDDVRVRYLDEDEYRPYDPHERAFFNVNTPDQLAQARQLAQHDAD